MKMTTLLFLGSLFISIPAFSVEEDKSEKPGVTPGDKMMEKIKKDPSKNPETSPEFSSENLSQFAKKPIFSSESADQKERDKVVEGNLNKFNQVSANHVETLYKCSKLSDPNAAKDCRKNEIKTKKK